MTKFCESCHAANKDGARYCCGCKGRFSGVRFGAHTSAADFDNSRKAALARRPTPRPHMRLPVRRIRRTGLAAIGAMALLGALVYAYKNPAVLGWTPIHVSVSFMWKPAGGPAAGAATSTRQPALVPAPVPVPAAPPEPGTATLPAPARDGVDSAERKECSDAREALALCPNS